MAVVAYLVQVEGLLFYKKWGGWYFGKFNQLIPNSEWKVDTLTLSTLCHRFLLRSSEVTLSALANLAKFELIKVTNERHGSTYLIQSRNSRTLQAKDWKERNTTDLLRIIWVVVFFRTSLFNTSSLKSTNEFLMCAEKTFKNVTVLFCAATHVHLARDIGQCMRVVQVINHISSRS